MKTIPRAFFMLDPFFLPLATAWSEEPPPGLPEGHELLKIEQAPDCLSSEGIQWKYQPAHLQGEPIPMVMQIDFNFDPNGSFL